MTESNNDNITLPQAIRKSAIGLAIFAFFTAGIISVTQFLTRENIQQNENAFEARLLLSLLPDKAYDPNTLLASAKTFSDADVSDTTLLNLGADESYYLAIGDSGEVDAVLLPVIAPEGYTEAIRLIVGIHPDGEVIGVRVTRHKETPGLGDKVDISKSDWITLFDNTSLVQPDEEDWQVKKDGGAFDQMTGATITPRAVVKAVKQSLQFFGQNKAALLSSSADTMENAS